MIRLSRLTDYAVTLLTHMVSKEENVWAASDLAEKTGFPSPTVSKVLKQLTKSQITTATRGASGGYRLSRPASAISIASIIEAMDGPIAITDCAEGSVRNCNVEAVCSMSGHWDMVNQVIRRALEDVTLAEMATPHPRGQTHEGAQASQRAVVGG